MRVELGLLLPAFLALVAVVLIADDPWLARYAVPTALLLPPAVCLIACWAPEHHGADVLYWIRGLAAGACVVALFAGALAVVGAAAVVVVAAMVAQRRGEHG